MLPLKKPQTTVFNRIFSAYSIITSNNFLTVIPEVKQKEDKCLHMQLLKLVLDNSRLLFCYFRPNNFLHYILLSSVMSHPILFAFDTFFRKLFSCTEGLPGTIFLA